jgi:hypothetical protein
MESKIQRDIIAYLESQGAYVVKVILSNRNGTADLLCSVNGLFVAFEIKDKFKTADPLQIYKLVDVVKSKGFGFVVDNLEDVKNIFSKISRFEAPRIAELPMNVLHLKENYNQAKQIVGF